MAGEMDNFSGFRHVIVSFDTMNTIESPFLFSLIL